MDKKVENKVELFRQFLFHYRNWVEAWLLEHPLNRFKTQDEYLKAFDTANRTRLASMQDRYSLNKETVKLFINDLNTN
ncbi:MAG TPA: hypothetical protein PKC55_10530 [Dysgonomonas sp.]|uniref:hypothetical protein n=1 Tax=unclassified Dysgonomonas TaxID=2630389 RepID=UPI0025BA147D|nr:MULTISPECIES: hypothetical protein [unclassified Dysgonomonas]HML65256.1 hypothetical protein [Dysgonomonas sp.]